MVGGLYASDALTVGKVYDLPAAEVRSELVAMPLFPELIAVAGVSDAASVEIDQGASWVRWQISSGDRTVSRFTAHFSSEAPGRTRVTLEQDKLDPGTDRARRISETKFMRGYTQSSFAEQIDARLEGRAYDRANVMQTFGEHHARNPEEVRELGLAVGEMFNEVSNEAMFAVHSGGLVEADVRLQMEAATRPSIELPTQRQEWGD